MDLRGKVITAALVWTGKTFEHHIHIRTDSNGVIVDIGKHLLKPDETVVDLGNKALLPGFVNAHSHAFHRHMRGRSRIGSEDSDSFWKWRDDMYALLENVDREQLYQYTLATFREMLSAGITTVGEFHYVHHGKERFELDKAILDAARDAHIRIVLIDTLYSRAGFGSEQLVNTQKRFVSQFDEFTESVNDLDNVKDSNQTVAVAAHSLRAVSMEDCKRLSEWAMIRGKPLHIHVEEQPKEMDDCNAALDSIPSQLLIDNLSHHLQLTAVHCTFTPKCNMLTFAERRINVCVCPLTEGYLGDGIPNITDESQLCLGTDCNNRICMLEEMRWLTYCQHMKENSRRVCGLNAHKLLRIATENGARSLGLQGKVGLFERGMELDMVAFDLSSARISPSCPDELLDAIVFGAGNEDIVATAVSARIVFTR